MTDDLRRAFAEITARLEDMHAIAVDGQCRDNTADMHRVLASHLKMGLDAMAGVVGKIADRLGNTHD
jgi:hypothetical protein